jgi:hypothetical protein
MKNSEAPFSIGIGYPSSRKSWNNYVKRIKTLHRNMATGKEFMFILDPAYFGNIEDDITGYVARPRRQNLREISATRYHAPDGTFYSTWRDDRETDEDEE